MARRDYDRLSVETFGRELIVSGDLDPIYVALARTSMDDMQRSRWLIAYWCLYSAGVSSWLSEQEGEDFWKQLLVAAANEQPAPTGLRWPRASERRHWRGGQAVRSAMELAQRWPDPYDFIEYISCRAEGDPRGAASLPFPEISKRVKEHRGFGDWIAFKVADMLERVMNIPVDFTQSQIFMYTDPVKGALMVWRHKVGCADYIKPKDQNAAITEVVGHLEKEFADLKAPPGRDRPVGIQEVETVLCKWKSHMNGHYPVGNDTIEIGHALEPWLEHSKTAMDFKAAMPQLSEKGKTSV